MSGNLLDRLRSRRSSLCAEAANEIDRLQCLLGRYGAKVGSAEGTDYLHSPYGPGLTADEVLEISGYIDLAEARELPAN